MGEHLWVRGIAQGPTGVVNRLVACDFYLPRPTEQRARADTDQD